MTLRVTALGPARAGLSRASEMIDQIKKLQRAITIIITDTHHRHPGAWTLQPALCVAPRASNSRSDRS